MQQTRPAQINFGRAFSYILEDPEWVRKSLIGALFVILSLFILPIFVIAGYYLELIQNVARGNPRPLPEWDNIGDKFVKGLVFGLKLLVVTLVYALPIIIITILQVAISAIASDSKTGGGLVLLTIPLSLLSMVFSIALAFVSPLLTIHVIRDSMSEAFNFPLIIKEIRENFVNLLLVVLGMLLAGFVAQLGFIACLIGVVWTAFLAQLVEGNLIGQLWRSYEGLSNTPDITPQPTNPYMTQP